VQTVHAVADPIGPGDVPEAWQADSSIVLLGPLVNEVAPAVAAMFPDTLLGIVPQGWMRQWNEQGLVSHVPMDCASEVLAHADVLMLSVEDVDDDLSLAECYHDMVDIMVLTRSDYGCDVYQSGKIVPVPPRPAKEVDPTGAGDVFSTAFLIRLWETGDPMVSARFANVMASFSIEGLAYHAIPTREEVETWLAQND
jgi:sugar/nucleoside kinase (ribokinase family)